MNLAGSSGSVKFGNSCVAVVIASRLGSYAIAFKRAYGKWDC